MLNGNGGRRNRFAALALAIFGVMAAVGIAVATAGTLSSPPSEQQYEAGARAEVARAPSAAQLQALGILRRSQTASDALPQELATRLAANERFTGMDGANVALARRAGGASGAAWVIPGTGTVCLAAFSSADASEGPGKLSAASCQQEASAETGRMYVESKGVNAPGTVFIAGVVPDGVSAVTLDLAGGGSVSVAVHENVYMDQISGEAADLQFNGPNGPVSVGGLQMGSATTGA